MTPRSLVKVHGAGYTTSSSGRAKAAVATDVAMICRLRHRMFRSALKQIWTGNGRCAVGGRWRPSTTEWRTSTQGEAVCRLRGSAAVVPGAVTRSRDRSRAHRAQPPTSATRSAAGTAWHGSSCDASVCVPGRAPCGGVGFAPARFGPVASRCRQRCIQPMRNGSGQRPPRQVPAAVEGEEERYAKF